jgi:hypothetical protein
MAGTAARHWKELRPSSAGRFRLDAAIRHDREYTGRNLRRPRNHSRPKLRASSRWSAAPRAPDRAATRFCMRGLGAVRGMRR